MSARRVWIATCEVCETTQEFDGGLTEDDLGREILAAGWELPRFGGTFCRRCSDAVRRLGARS